MGISRILTLAGSVLVLIGAAVSFGFGRLPGDITVRSGHATFYFPIVSSIVASIILTFLFNLFMRH